MFESWSRGIDRCVIKISKKFVYLQKENFKHMNEAQKNEQNKVKTILHNMALDKDFSSVYSDVDGLSLQNLFYVKNNYFPYCDMFT